MMNPVQPRCPSGSPTRTCRWRRAEARKVRSMIAADEARTLALVLPGAEANSHFDTPDFRVNGKIFATLPGPDRMIVRMDPTSQAVLVAAEPATFAPCPGAWGLKGWTIVQLETVTPDMLHDLLVDSWGQIVGKRAAAAHDASR